MRALSFNPATLARRRFIGALLFVAVFFLPLHFHSVTLTAQVTKECSCVHGSRTQAGLAPAPADWLPVFVFELIAPHAQDVSFVSSLQILHIRAPPPPASL